jgi:hypothetical protein
MPTSAIRLALVVLLSGLAACSSSSSSTGGGGGGGTLTVTATPTKIRANGTATSAIHVDGATRAPIKLATTRGTFVDTGTKNVSVDATTADVTLQACDSSDATCTGSISVTAVDGAFATGRVQVSLIGRETICNDGIDNNGDGNIDCADPDCNLQACKTATGAAGTCNANVCVASVCTPTEATETTCNDGIDNDCKNGADCADAACDGKQCGTAATSVCQNKACVDLAAGIGLTLTPARSRLPADGTATTTVTATVTKDNSPLAGSQVTLQTTLGTFVGAPAPGTAVTVGTNANGEAIATFQASAAAGTATITAFPATVPLLSVTTQIAMPALGSIQLVTAGDPAFKQVLGVKYSGWNEQSAIQVLLLDTDQKPYPDGLKVSFEHQQFGGSEISQPWTDTATCLASAGCLHYDSVTVSPSGSPDTAGIAKVNLYSGTAAGLVTILVSATAGGSPRSYPIQNIAIIGAKASGAHVSLACTPKNLPALGFDRDCINTFYSGKESPITCTAFLGDRFNNVLGLPVLVTFLSEAGEPGPPVFTTAYDPTKGGDQTASLGRVTNTVAVAGRPMPADVAPFAGEPTFVNASDPCGHTTHNPRDGLVTIIAMAQGEEGFVDQNGNGVWDSGEPYIDMGEPFVDVNDNGIWDPGEPFFDVNNNGVYDGPNGRWDANTVVWTQTRVLYTGFGIHNTVVPSGTITVNSSTPGPATTATAVVSFSDENLNPVTPYASYEATSETTYCTPKVLFAPPSVDNLGMSFTLRYCDRPAGTPGAVCSSACTTSPCYVVPSVGNYAQVAAGVISITGGGTAATTDTVDVSCTIDDVTDPAAVRIPVRIN